MLPYRLSFSLILFLFTPILFLSQVDLSTMKSNTSTKTNWKKYTKQEGILIEYSFQQDNPTRAYKGEYLLLKITNSSNLNRHISWDFSAIYNSERCLNCDSNNEELHFENTVKANSSLTGNINNNKKGPLVIFHKFTDENYKGKRALKWQSFELKKLHIK